MEGDESVRWTIQLVPAPPHAQRRDKEPSDIFKASTGTPRLPALLLIPSPPERGREKQAAVWDGGKVLFL